MHPERLNVFAAAVVATCGLLAVPAAVAKDFGPGDLRVCGRSQCVPIVNERLLKILSAYYYGPRRVVRAAPVRHGAPARVCAAVEGRIRLGRRRGGEPRSVSRSGFLLRPLRAREVVPLPGRRRRRSADDDGRDAPAAGHGPAPLLLSEAA